MTAESVRASQPELKLAFQDGIATLLVVPADTVTIKAIYVATSRLLSLAQAGRSLAARDVSVDFEVVTTVGDASAALKDVLTAALSGNTTASAPFASAVSTMLSSVATAAGLPPGALTATVTAIVSAPIAQPLHPLDTAGSKVVVFVYGAVAGAGVVALILVALGVYLVKKGLLLPGRSAKVAPAPLTEGQQPVGGATAKVAPMPEVSVHDEAQPFAGSSGVAL